MAGIAISIPPEYNTGISRDAQIALTLQRLEEDNMQNMEKKEQMIMRDGEFSTMVQQQEEDEAQKSMDKEQQDMTSTPTGNSLLIVQGFLSLHRFFSLTYPRTWSSPQK